MAITTQLHSAWFRITLVLAGTWGLLYSDEPTNPRVAPPAAPTPDIQQAADSVTGFTFDLYRRVAAEADGNVFLSPYSAYGALLMVAEGARGTAAEELGTLLHFPPSAREPGNEETPWKTRPMLKAFSDLGLSLAPRTGAAVQAQREELAGLERQLRRLQRPKASRPSFEPAQREVELVDRINALRQVLDPYELNIANAVWFDARFTLSPAYRAVVTKDYGGTATTVDFRSKPAEACATINQWASRNTRGRIPKIAEPEMIDDFTRMMLTNAVYFKGAWVKPFEAERTKEEDFTPAAGPSSRCMLMSDFRAARYAEYRPDGTLNTLVKVPPPPGSPFAFEWKWADNPDGWKVLELPYKGDRLTLVAILPGRADGVAHLESRLEAKTLGAWLQGTQHQEVRILMPRFKVEGSYDHLETQFKQLGMKGVTVPGGLTGVSDHPDGKFLLVSQVIQKTFVELNEKGTEAAAVTLIGMGAGSAPQREPPPPPPEFRADHPFLFLIRDTQTGAVLFVGRIAKP